MDQPWVYIVLAGLIIIVYAKIAPKTQSGKAKGNVGLSEMEETMEHFAAELEEQNQALIRMFSETKREYELHSAKLSGRVEQLEKQNDQLMNGMNKLSFLQEQAENRQYVAKLADNKLQEVMQTSPGKQPVPVVNEEKPVNIQPPASLMNIKVRYRELFQLYQQGKSTDFIAKKLGMNKGEISLILQLAKREEQTNG